MASIKEIEQMDALRSADLEGHEVDPSVIWEEEPAASFREFNESQAYLGAFPLSGRQYYDVEQLVGLEPKNTFNPNRKYDQLVLVYGKGGGKDEVASRIALYIVHLLLCLRSPQEYLLGIRSRSNLHLINVAKKGRQAEKVFFQYFKNNLLGSRWYKDRFDITERNQWYSKVVKRSKVRGKIIVTGNGIIFPKNIEAVAETTENESWEGYNPVLYVLDEISGFTSAVELEKAWKIYNTAKSSTDSRVTRNFKGLGVVMSYPRQDEGDVILELFKQSQEGGRCFGSLAYPWQSKGMHNFSADTFVLSHPRISSYFDLESCGIEIPVNFLGSFDSHDPRTLDDSITKFLCIPPPTSGGWLEYPERIKPLISSKTDPESPRHRLPLFETRDIIEHTADQDGNVVHYLIKQLQYCRARSPYERLEIPRVAWLDAAQKHCDAVLSIGHLEQRVIDSGGQAVSIETVVVDDELTWRPDASRGIQVSLSNIEQWLTVIIPDSIRLVAVGADAWNSAHLEEKLRKRGIKVEIHNLNLEDYDLLKRQIYLGGMDFIEGETPGQLRNLIYAGVNHKPVRKPGFLQDLADGVCGLVRLLTGRDARGHLSAGRRAIESLPVPVIGGMSPVSNPMDRIEGAPSMGSGGIRNIPLPRGSGVQRSSTPPAQGPSRGLPRPVTLGR